MATLPILVYPRSHIIKHFWTWHKKAVLFEQKTASVCPVSSDRILAAAWHWPCRLDSEELTPLLQRKLTWVASNTLTISHSQRVAFLQPWQASNVAISPKFTVLDVELLVPKMGFPANSNWDWHRHSGCRVGVSFFFIFFLCFSLPLL